MPVPGSSTNLIENTKSKLRIVFVSGYLKLIGVYVTGKVLNPVLYRIPSHSIEC